MLKRIFSLLVAITILLSVPVISVSGAGENPIPEAEAKMAF